jgi:hypothetical protein
MEKVLLYMETGVGYLTADGVDFSREHPYQLVDRPESEILLSTQRFRNASPEELRSYYGYKVAT